MRSRLLVSTEWELYTEGRESEDGEGEQEWMIMKRKEEEAVLYVQYFPGK